MLSRRTRRGPLTGVFQMPVWIVLPCQAMSRGRPTLTESKRPITFPNDDRANLKHPPKGRLAVSRGALWLRPASKPLQALQTIMSGSNYDTDIAVLGRTFPSDLRRTRLISTYEQRAPLVRSLISAISGQARL